MNNSIKERILKDRISDLRQLEPALRAAVQADAELLALIAENRVFAGLAGSAAQPAPARLAGLQAAMRNEGATHKETQMTMFARLFSGRHPLAQAALACAVLAVFSVGFLAFMGRSSVPAWSQVSGNVLEYSIGDLPGGEDALQPLLDTYMEKVREAKQEYFGDKAEDCKTVQISVNVESHSDDPNVEPVPQASLVISLMEQDDEFLALIQKKVAEIPGAPVPVVQSATWFYGPEGPGQGGMRFKVEDQIFNFPDTATEEEVETEIRNWLATNRPGKDYVVDITIERDTDAEGRERMKVMADIHEVGEEGHKTGVQSPAHPPIKR